jgi:hypothetical protein
MPDRIVLLPGGHIGLCGGQGSRQKPRPLQLGKAWTASAAGLQGLCLDQPEQIGGILDEIYK